MRGGGASVDLETSIKDRTLQGTRKVVPGSRRGPGLGLTRGSCLRHEPAPHPFTPVRCPPDSVPVPFADKWHEVHGYGVRPADGSREGRGRRDDKWGDETE